jgi:HAE1 family hydrophobic/amphiphilic exporter-1
MVTVSALPKGDDLTAASASVNKALEEVKLPTGADASIGGVQAQQLESFQQLGLALLAAILIVYVVMVATFRSLLQPLLLLVSVPFAATGAILLLVATGIPLGVASLIGVLMLVGIVVTNAIVLIDLVNQYRTRAMPLREAVLEGSLNRLRPIIMTALATIFALTPMALGITGKGGFISQPLAVVVIGGLLSSTLLTLVVLPTLYFAVERARERGRDRRAQRSGASEPPVIAPELAVALAGAGVVPVVEESPVAMSAQASDSMPAAGEPAAGEPADEEPFDEEPSDDEPVDEEPAEAVVIPELQFTEQNDTAPEPLQDAATSNEVHESHESHESAGLPTLPEPVDPEPTFESVIAEQVPPTTAQLNWEALMWQATQEPEESGSQEPSAQDEHREQD